MAHEKVGKEQGMGRQENAIVDNTEKSKIP